MEENKTTNNTDISREDTELREYQKKSMAVRAVTAVLALAAAAITGYIGRKGRQK
jgi:hypothetical protein